MNYKEQAIKKLTDEHKNGKFDRYGQAVKNEVLKALTEFIRQDDEFAQAIVQSSGTFSQCIEKAMKGCGSSISDIEVYRRCVQFYFKGATVDFKMEINLIGDGARPHPVGDEGRAEKWQPSQSGGEARGTATDAVTATGEAAKPKKISLSLLDFI